MSHFLNQNFLHQFPYKYLKDFPKNQYQLIGRAQKFPIQFSTHKFLIQQNYLHQSVPIRITAFKNKIIVLDFFFNFTNRHFRKFSKNLNAIKIFIFTLIFYSNQIQLFSELPMED